MRNVRQIAVRLVLAGLAVWLVLCEIDGEIPTRYHLRMDILPRGTCLVYSAYNVIGQERMHISAGRRIPAGRDPVTVAIPVPRTGVETVWVRVLSDGPSVDVLSLTGWQSGSLCWPSHLLRRFPLDLVKANRTHSPAAPVEPVGVRFSLDEEDTALLKLRMTNQIKVPPAAAAIPFLQRTVSSLVVAGILLGVWRRRGPLLHFGRTPACGALMLAGGACLLLFAASRFPPPTEAADELSYMQASYGISREPCPPGYQRLYWPLPNLLYTGLGRLAFALSPHGEVVMQRMQIAIYVVACGLLWMLARRLTTQGWANAAAGFAVVSAFHSHTRYFMPDAVYGSLFMGLAVWWCMVGARRPAIAASGAGLLCAALFLVKPHALALMPAMGGCCLIVPWVVAEPGMPARLKVRSALVGGGWFAGSTLASLALLSWFLAPFKQDPATTGILADYTGMLDLLIRFKPSTWQAIGAFAKLAAAQFILAAPYLAVPLFLAPGLLSSGDALPPPRRAEMRRLVLFTLMTFLVAYAMTIHFTLRIGEHAFASPDRGDGLYFRAHGRYWSYVLPLFFVIFAAGIGHPPSARAVRRPLVIAGIVALVLSMLLLTRAAPRAAVLWYDFPEVYGLTRRIGLALAVVCLLVQVVAVGLSGRRGSAQAAALGMLAYAGFSAIVVFQDSRQWSQEQRHQVEAGRKFAESIPAAERSSTVLASSFAHTEFYYSFGFRFSPVFSVDRPSAIPDVESLPAGARWLVTHEAANPLASDQPRLVPVSRYMGYKLFAVAPPEQRHE